MEVIWILVVGALFSAGIYLMMERHLLKILFGVVILSNGINLALFIAGKMTFAKPPFIGEDQEALSEIANSVPQALILTAIVIGFGLLIFVLLLIYRVFKETQTIDIDKLLEKDVSSDK